MLNACDSRLSKSVDFWCIYWDSALIHIPLPIDGRAYLPRFASQDEFFWWHSPISPSSLPTPSRRFQNALFGYSNSPNQLNRKNGALEGRQWYSYVCAAVWKQVVWGEDSLQVFLGISREGISSFIHISDILLKHSMHHRGSLC